MYHFFGVIFFTNPDPDTCYKSSLGTILCHSKVISIPPGFLPGFVDWCSFTRESLGSKVENSTFVVGGIFCPKGAPRGIREESASHHLIAVTYPPNPLHPVFLEAAGTQGMDPPPVTSHRPLPLRQGEGVRSTLLPCFLWVPVGSYGFLLESFDLLIF